MNALYELEQAVFAEEKDDTEKKLQESAARQDKEPLSETYLDQRIDEEERIRQFNVEKMNILGITPPNSPDHNQNDQNGSK